VVNTCIPIGNNRQAPRFLPILRSVSGNWDFAFRTEARLYPKGIFLARGPRFSYIRGRVAGGGMFDIPET